MTPLLDICFRCRCNDGTALTPFHGVSICSDCNCRLSEYGGTVTRDVLMSTFGLSKPEADRLPRKIAYGGYYKVCACVRQEALLAAHRTACLLALHCIACCSTCCLHRQVNPSDSV